MKKRYIHYIAALGLLLLTAFAPPAFSMASRQMLESSNSMINYFADTMTLTTLLDNASLDTQNPDEKRLSQAIDALHHNLPAHALRIFKQISNVPALSPEAQQVYEIIAVQAYLRTQDLKNSTLARIQLNSLLTDTQAQIQNENIIFYGLQTLSLDDLKQLSSHANSPAMKGWIKLGILAKENANDATALWQTIAQWEKENVDHPANQLLPNPEALNALATATPPHQIALLLPLQGSFASMGKVVRDGFMTAFYSTAKINHSALQIKIYDTTQTDDIVSLYQKAIQDGADTVIGPLTKSNVEKLIDADHFPVPTIVLNYVDNEKRIDANLIQLGLSPIQAAEQSAFMAWQKGVSHVLLIAPNNDFGEKTQNAFMQTFQQIGGYVADRFLLDPSAALSPQIRTALQVDDSQARIKNISDVLNRTDIKSSPRRRQDIDSIFLVTSPTQARQIYPLLKFYDAETLPVFSIYTIYSGAPNAQADHDLNDIYFDDIPLMVSDNPLHQAEREQLQSLWSNQYDNQNRMYGIGMDAFLIATEWSRLLTLPNFALAGATGQLYLLPNQQIYQQLFEVQFKNGLATPVAP